MENVCSACSVSFPEIHIAPDLHVLEYSADRLDQSVMIVTALMLELVSGDRCAGSVLGVIVGFNIVRKDVSDIEDSDRQVGDIPFIGIEDIMIVDGRINFMLGLGQ